MTPATCRGRPPPRAGARAVALRAALAVACVLLGGRAAAAQESAAAAMPGFYGSYPMEREGSGTSWQPDSTPMQGLHEMSDRWMYMLHGFANLIYDEQGGPRGATKTFSSSMLMFMARRELGDGAVGVHLGISADPLMGKDGYPLLFQTGETADGHTPLIDRQHPHDLLMEAALSYSRALGREDSVFVYAGLPGEPALGPEAFMHRLSGMDNPEAPLGHHWLDSTHITWGVVTAGYVWKQLKVEASGFNGREPDDNRYNIEVRSFDSYAARLTYNPGPAVSMQASFGRLASPEQLEPQISVQRTTASVSYNAPLGIWWQTTFAFGHNSPSMGQGSNAWLLESALKPAAAHTVFARAERVDKDELFLPGAALYGRSFTIEKLSVGYVYDFLRLGPLDLGLGGLVSTYSFPAALNSTYGDRPTSFMVFLRARL